MKIWTYRVQRPDEFTEAVIRNGDFLGGLRFLVPSPIEDKWPSDVTFDVVTKRAPSDIAWGGPMMLLSESALRQLKSCVPSTEFEALPATLVYRRKKIKYSVLHLLSELDILDRKRSKYTEFKGWVDEIEKLALDEGKAETARLFKLKSLEQVVCVHDDVANVMSLCSGSHFESPEEWVPDTAKPPRQ
jgi:hypothetical protein